MKTPLLALLLFAPLHPVALACENCDASCASLVEKATSAHLAAKPATPRATVSHAPASPATPRAEKSRRAPGSRPPAYLFM